MPFDAIIIGSGFGGAVVACRLAEAGATVLVLERGRRWDPAAYPRRPTDPWFWSQSLPHKLNGWIDFRAMGKVSVIQGAGVGGGSLIYANVSCEAPPQTFAEGWPREITYDELRPYYERAGKFLNVQKTPDGQLPPSTHMLRRGAERIGAGDRFRLLDLAVSFDPDWAIDRPDANQPSASKRFTNAQGVEQGTCVHCGNCCIGCEVKAKNTLDLNYIPWAERHGAEVRPLHLVNSIVPEGGGYRVHFDRLDTGRRVAGSEVGSKVFVAAGSLGSTELLLRCRDESGSLPKLSPMLGRNWSTNGDFLTPAFYRDGECSPSKGPTVTGAIDFLDGSRDGQRFWIQDGGLPDLLGAYLRQWSQRAGQGSVGRRLLGPLNAHLADRDVFKRTMLWFAQAVDGPGGVLSLKRRWKWFGGKVLGLAIDMAQVEPAVNAVVRTHLELAKATGGTPVVPPTWTIGKCLTTPHPLGGCPMGDTIESGVVDHKGEVFGYNNLSVADGAIIPRALGVNPSRTITALAERIGELEARG